MFLLSQLSGFFSKYVWIALIITTTSTITFSYLYKEALQDVARVEVEAQRDALEAANERATNVAARVAKATATREKQLLDQIANLDAIRTAASKRAEQAEEALSNFETESQSDQTPEYEEWKGDKLPSGVVTRLRGLQQGATIAPEL